MTTSSPPFLLAAPLHSHSHSHHHSHDAFFTPAFVMPRGGVAHFSPTKPLMHQGPLLPAMPPKLPSLEGLLKRIHGDADVAPHSPQHVSAMPSLRSILSPSMVESVLPIGGDSPSISRKRSWEETSSVSDSCSERSMSPCKMSRPNPPQRSRASKYCKIEGCERVSQRNNLCHSHGGKRLCKEDGCSSKDRGNGFCIKHGGGKICSMSGCEKKARRKGLCTQHFRLTDATLPDSFV
ncbi:hypothetical protein PINS_up010185 [Pythium insidiosum]|nr:hypothetical protein PINS_up010185 [Pythium insidiosum]